jgi:drug/metabolite transporter (DMT)-like permease
MKAPHSQNVIGILSLCGGVFILSLQDAILKGMSGDHSVTLAIVLRSIVSVPLLLAMVAYANGLSALKTKRWKLLIARGLILLTSYTSYYIAFPALPLSEAVALFFTSPIFVTLLASIMLREKVTPKAWAAVIGGFIGVLIILRPGSGLFEPAALLSLFSAASYAFSMVLARKYTEAPGFLLVSAAYSAALSRSSSPNRSNTLRLRVPGTMDPISTTPRVQSWNQNARKSCMASGFGRSGPSAFMGRSLTARPPDVQRRA